MRVPILDAFFGGKGGIHDSLIAERSCNSRLRMLGVKLILLLHPTQAKET